MDVWVLLSDIVILLTGALIIGGIFSRFGQSPIVGYLLAGMVLGGPGSVSAIRAEGHIEAISELGVSLLMFSIGLEFSWTQLKRLGTRRLIAGTLQVVLTTLLAATIAAMFGLSSREAIAVGMMVSLSSTAVVFRILMERAEVDSYYGRNSIAILLVQDVAVVPLALLMTLLGTGGAPSDVISEIGRTLLLASLLILGLYVVVNKLAVYALSTLSLDRNRELTVLLAVVTGLGSAWAAHEAGISPALGAFMGGMFLGSSQFATQIRADVSSLRIVLLTLFFSSAGMVADPEWIIEHWYLVLGVAGILIVGKFAVVWAICRALGQLSTIAIATGLCLAQIGEFAFALGAIGRGNGVIAGDTYRLIVSVTIVTLLISPYLVPNAQRLAAWLANRSQREGPLDETGERLGRVAPHVAIIGFGPAGQVAAQPFIGRTTRVLVVDLNRENVQKARHWGLDALVGDATQSEVLHHARLVAAKAVVITIPHYASAMTILGQVLQLAPQAHTVVRSRYQAHSDDFLRAGADVVIGDEEEMGNALGRHIEKWLAAVEHSETHRSMVQVKAIDASN